MMINFDINPGTVESIIYEYSWKHVKIFPTVKKNQKLMEQDVIDIRKEMSCTPNKVDKRKELAIKYGISSHSVYEIETKRKWKNVL